MEVLQERLGGGEKAESTYQNLPDEKDKTPLLRTVQLSGSIARKTQRKSWEHISKSPREAEIKISTGSLQAPRSLYKHSVSVTMLAYIYGVTILAYIGDQARSVQNHKYDLWANNTSLHWGQAHSV